MIIDDATISGLIQKEIQSAVDKYVASATQDQQWQQDLQQGITEYVQQRITAKFQNISSMPDLIETVNNSVKCLFDQGHIPGIDRLIDPVQLKLSIDSSVQELITNTLDQLLTDASWINKIQQMIEYNVTSKSLEMIRDVDIRSMVATEVQANFDHWRQKLEHEILGRGLRDMATNCELVITDGSVVAQSGLACGHMLVEKDLVTQNLVVTGTVNTDCASWDELADTVADRTRRSLGDQWLQELCQQTLDLAKTSGIDFHDIRLGDQPLVQGQVLSSRITETNIKKLGPLEDLTVLGAASLARTLTSKDRRVGINTDSPDMALTIWDEEVSVSVGKHSRDRAWIGSSRNHALDIGVNRKRAISIEPDGLVVVDRLRVDRWRISFGNAVPNHSGTRGDLVINHDPRPGTPWAWQCLGAFQWQPLSIA